VGGLDTVGFRDSHLFPKANLVGLDVARPPRVLKQHRQRRPRACRRVQELEVHHALLLQPYVVRLLQLALRVDGDDLFGDRRLLGKESSMRTLAIALLLQPDVVRLQQLALSIDRDDLWQDHPPPSAWFLCGT